tara:strand:+ start:684 stop:980 length:297 start_codon:yes stop_codon:yes gene_type:complete
MAITQINAEDKTYENEVQEVVQLKNIIDSKEAEITALKSVIDELKLAKVQAVEKANNLMVNHICKNEKELNEVKDDNKKLSQQITDLKKEAKDLLLYP